MSITRWQHVGRAVVFGWFCLGGIAHFVWPAAFASIVPPSLPFKEAAVAITGVFELLGAIGILLPRYRRIAGIGLIALTLCVTPANVYMWWHAEQFAPIPSWLLLVRLPLQVLLIVCILWSTQLLGHRRCAVS
ncbi:DoxX family protein [uncultured Kushneria sp.]|uniref:DoxX family protein n=1 Tax=uncultured Kushneria sp. TaxID=905033 RepID=UPI002615F690|nr:DoxX family protein [uncultured Kushneria sp.]